METLTLSEPESEKLMAGPRRGRPKLECRVYQVRFTLSLREEEDDDLLSFFACIPVGRRSAAVKSALRSGGVSLEAGSVASSDDLDQTIQGLVFG